MKSQKGSAHIIIIVVLIVALVGALGYVFWQNVINKNAADQQAKTSDDTKPDATKKVDYKTFNLKPLGMSFKYPSTWSVDVKYDGTVEDEYGFKQLEVAIDDEHGQQIAVLQNANGLGGTCDNPQSYETLEATKMNLNTENLVTFGLTSLKAADGSYEVHYGLTDNYTTKETSKVCDNTFYYLFDPGKESLGGGIAFGNEVIDKAHFANLEQVKAFMASANYEKLRTMIMSFKY